jgi:hypothetical protein
MRKSLQQFGPALADAIGIAGLAAVLWMSWCVLSHTWFWIVVSTAMVLTIILGSSQLSLAWHKRRELAKAGGIGMRVGLALLLLASIGVGYWLYQQFAPWGLEVIYYNDVQCQKPARRVSERALCRDYERRSPALGVAADHYSARWHGILRVPETADYKFYSQSDDGLRLLIDNRMIIDNWRDQVWGDSAASAQLRLTAGDHPIRVEHYNREGQGALRVKWSGGPIPANTVLAVPYLRKR